MEPRIFISHRHNDSEIADVLREHLLLWGLPRASIWQSSALTGGPAIGQRLTDQLLTTLRDSQLVILVYTFPDADWSYCMWETGIATDPSGRGTRVVVLQCTEERPPVFADLVSVTIDEESIAAFVKQFHRDEDFFPKQPAYSPQVADVALEARAEALYKALCKVVPTGGLERWTYFEEMVRSHSIFGVPASDQPKRDIFVLMPFRDDLTPIYEDHLKRCAKRIGMSCGRADDFFSNKSIMEDIWSGICHARLVIADCTGRNPNVFYEIGIVHTLDKKTILIAQSVDDVPFDLRHRRVLVYQFTPRGMSKFEEDFEKAVKSVLREPSL